MFPEGGPLASWIRYMFAEISTENTCPFGRSCDISQTHRFVSLVFTGRREFCIFRGVHDIVKFVPKALARNFTEGMVLTCQIRLHAVE